MKNEMKKLIQNLSFDEFQEMIQLARKEKGFILFGHFTTKEVLRDEIDCTDEVFEEFCNADTSDGLYGDESYADFFERWKECQ